MIRRKRRPNPERSRVVVNGQGLNNRQERQWRLANDDVDSGDSVRLRRGLATLAALEIELAEEKSAAALREGVAETIALERGRGETVETPTTPRGRGRVRIQTRDGLETLRKTGAIDARQHRAGLAYRELYEAADPERALKSQMGDLDRRGDRALPDSRAEIWAERRLRLSAKLAVIETRISVAERSGHGLRALREVAGHARCLSHFVRGGGAQAHYRRALVGALDVCADHFNLR